MPRLALTLMGGFEARLGDHVLAFPTRHAVLLLAWLALAPDRAHQRETLAGLLWPDRPDEQARTSLRQTLYRLRAALENAEPFPLEVTARTVRLTGAAVDCDVARIEAAGPGDPAALTRAVELARGELLDGIEGGEPDIDTWLLGERARIRRTVIERLEQLSHMHEAAHRYDAAEVLARRHLAFDPYDEVALRRLMMAAGHQGRRNAALEAFRAHSERLRNELSVAPEPETVSLWQAIRGGRPLRPKDESADGLEPPDATPGDAEPIPVDPAPEPQPSSSPDNAASPLLFQFGSHVERRHIAALHLSILMAAQPVDDWDPEAAALAWESRRIQLEAIVARHGGQVVQAATNELVAVFADAEHPALIATRAAIEARASAGVAGGVHAGEALVGERIDPGPVGLVARHLAEAGGGVTLSEAARGECDGYFSFTAGRDLNLPGRGGSLPTWQPTGSTGARNRWQARSRHGLTPLVGREPELDLLKRALGRSAGGATVVLVLGEAGIGKSRLIHEFLSEPAAASHRIIETGVASFQTESTYSALGTMVRSWCGVGTEASPQVAWEASLGRLEALGASEAIRPALRLLLDLPVQDEGWTGLSSSRKRRLMAEALHTLLELDGSAVPVILVFEDAHWLDADTAQVLDLLIEGLGSAPVLVLITGRPEFRPRWTRQSFVRQIRLEALDPDETSELIERLLGSEQASGAHAARLYERTGGVPLFLEEIARDLAEEGQGGSAMSQDAWDNDERGIPVSVRGVLSSRIDRLSPEQRIILQAASAIGPVVAESLLAPLAGLPDEQLGEALDGLTAAELLYKVRGFPDREYAFKHALTQEVAYCGVLRSRREVLHGELLDLLEQREGTPPEDLARHARLGGKWSKAAYYAALAGDRALTHSAYRMARVQFERALDALGRLPLVFETRRQMVDLHLRLRAILMVGDHSKVLDTLRQAEELALPLGDPRLLVEIRTHRAFFHATDGRFDDGLAAAELALAEAGSFSDPLLLAEARMAKGQLLRMRGDYQHAIDVLTPLLDVWSGPDRLYRGVNVGTRSIFARGHLAVCHAYLGHRRAAREVIDAARALAEETQRPADLQFALLQDGVVTELEGRVADSIPLFERALAIVRSAELPYFEDWILVELGEALLALGEVDRALALLTATDERPGQVAVEQFQALMGAVLGKARVLAGQTDLAEATLEKVLSYARRVGHRQLEQMALRRLSTAVASRDPDLAETLIDEAISVAERNGLTLGWAKCLEGRAALMAAQGRERDAAAARERAATLRQVLHGRP